MSQKNFPAARIKKKRQKKIYRNELYRNEQVNSQSQAILNAYNAWNL